MQGRAAGLQIMNTTGPRGRAVVRIRQQFAQRFEHPLIGWTDIGDAGNLSQINPSDIESIEILKDASSSAIYGSRGANGVIPDSDPHRQRRIDPGFGEPLTTHGCSPTNSMSGAIRRKMAQIANEELTNAGLPALYTGQYNNGTYYPSLIEIQQGKWSNTDWADLCMRTAVVNNTTATLSPLHRQGVDQSEL